jgi:vacuolar-type H+-ATPase subunit I/STV1
MDTDYQTVFDLIRTLQERHAATVEALDRAATERQTLREALANESRLCDLRGEDLARLRDRYAEAQVSRTAVEELQKNYDARGEELEAFRKRFANLEEFQRQVETLRAENLRVHLGREADDQTRATDEEWTRDDTIRKLRAQLAWAQGRNVLDRARRAEIPLPQEEDVED